MDKNTFDSSSLNTYLSCPRKYYWRYVRHLRKKGYKKAPLDFGTAIHEALRIWYVKHDAKEALEVFHELWDERFADRLRTHEKGEDLLIGYFQKYKKETFTWISKPEMSFKVDFLGSNFVGRFDGVIDFQGTPLVIDHKTATRMGNSYFNSYRPNMQMSAYVWAARQLFPELDIRGVMINVLYFTTKRMEYPREIIPRRDWEIQEFLDVASRNIANIKARDREDFKDWEPRWCSCTDWGTCQFRDLCTEKDPETLVDFLYKKDIWDPEDEFDIEKKKEALKNYKEMPRLHAKY